MRAWSTRGKARRTRPQSASVVFFSRASPPPEFDTVGWIDVLLRGRLGAWLQNRLRPGRPIDDLAQRIGLSAEALRAFQPTYREAFIPKRAGGQRRLLVPDEPTKILQRVLLRRVFGKLRAHGAACGFERGRSIVHNARAHVGQAVVIRMDVVDFFSSTRYDRLERYFSGLGWNAEAAALLVRLTTHDGGLPQGADQPAIEQPGELFAGREVDEPGRPVSRPLHALCRRHHVFVSQGLPAAHAGADPAGEANPRGPRLLGPSPQETEHSPPPPAPSGHRFGGQRAAATTPLVAPPLAGRPASPSGRPASHAHAGTARRLAIAASDDRRAKPGGRIRSVRKTVSASGRPSPWRERG